jgi:serine/threonine-protein kinase HipA
MTLSSDIEELWRRLVFSILITNLDDHLHNHGFLHVANGQWRLAPAFDVNPTPARARELKTWISEDLGPDASIDNAMKVSKLFGISLNRAKEILAKVEGAVSTWQNLATSREIGMTRRQADAYAEAFEHEERGKAVAAAAVSTTPVKAKNTRP